jgi:acetoin utilization deacetylase AcuC-like enzyme
LYWTSGEWENFIISNIIPAEVIHCICQISKEWNLIMGSNKIAFTTVHSADHKLEGHPEHPNRFKHFKSRNNFPTSIDIVNIASEPAEDESIRMVHPPQYLQALKEASQMGPGFLDYGDTYVTPTSYQSAINAVGGVLQVLKSILSGESQSGYALVRPPGHHASPTKAMGFCLLNNIALAAKVAQRQGCPKILIIDFDVHHGNGTQKVFEEDSTVSYISTHQSGIFPGTGYLHEVGVGEGKGTLANFPLPARAGDKALLSIFDQMITPLSHRFEPDFIMVSAGYDAHWTDPLASLQLTTFGFYQFSQKLTSLANSLCEGRILFVQEGGYDPDTLADCVRSVLFALSGNLPPALEQIAPPYPETSIDSLLEKARSIHKLP